MPTAKHRLSVILPIHNEEKILQTSCDAFAKHFDEFVGQKHWQYVFVENGSTDNSPNIIQNMLLKWKGSIALHLSKSDYGNALREGILNAEGKFILIMNVDHLWDPLYFQWAWKHRMDYDLIIGSKRADPTLNKQDQFRRILSAGLNALLQYLFDCVTAETHGMKLMTHETILPIAKSCKMRKGQFDSELTLRALRGCLWVAEVPVIYIEKRNPRNFMIKKILQNIINLFRFYKVMKNVPYKGHLKYRRFCRYDMMQLPH